MNSPIHRLLFALLAAIFGAVVVSASVVQADLKALTRAGSALVGLSTNGDLVRSTDDGANFTTTRAASGSALSNVVASANVVVAVGDAGFIVHSTDGGQNWTNATSPAFTGNLLDAAANGTLWVAVGKAAVEVDKARSNVTALWSDNGGQTWKIGTVPTLAGELRAVTYDGAAGRWTAVGSNGPSGARILTSTDGKTWTSLTPPVGTYPLTDVSSNGQGTVVAVGEAGTLLVSTDGGQTFNDDQSGLVSENLNVVVFSPNGSWVVGGDHFVQISYTVGGDASLMQAPVPGGGDIGAIVLDGNGEPVIAGDLAGYQTINFEGPGTQPLSAGSVTLTASASSGLPVSFELVSGPATLDGSVVTFTGAGTITVRAVQSGNENFNAAAPVERSFLVTDDGMSFETWRVSNFNALELEDPEISGPNAIVAADGLSNLLKYAFGLPAKTPVTVAPFAISVAESHFAFTYTRPTVRPDLVYTVEVSQDLVNWTSDGVVYETVSADAQSETVRAHYSHRSANAVFFRLQVQRGLPQG